MAEDVGELLAELHRVEAARVAADDDPVPPGEPGDQLAHLRIGREDIGARRLEERSIAGHLGLANELGEKLVDAELAGFEIVLELTGVDLVVDAPAGPRG